MSDRYRDAVQARRMELRVERGLLTGGHRTDLRSALALSRLGVVADAAARLRGLGREARAHVDGPDRAMRERLPALLAAAVDDLMVELHAGWAATALPALRRIAARRSLAMAPGWPQVPVPRPVAVPAELAEPRPRSLLAGAVDGAALWRLAVLPLAVLGLVGPSALAPLAAGIGLVALVVAVRARRTAGEQDRLRRHVDEVLAVARTAVDVEFGRQVLELERAAGAALDAAVTVRRREVEAELALLSAEPSDA